MNENDFKSMVEKYKRDLLKIAGLKTKSVDKSQDIQTQDSSTQENALSRVKSNPDVLNNDLSKTENNHISMVSGSLSETGNLNTQRESSVSDQDSTSIQGKDVSDIDQNEPRISLSQNNISQRSESSFFEENAPYSGNASIDNSKIETYQEFLDKNQENGFLKVQAFIARQTLPVSGVKIVVSKKFSDMDKVFFEGITDESGIIDNITLPAPSKILSETPEDVLPYAIYDFSSSHPLYDTQNADSIQIFQGIKSIQPVIALIK